MRRTRRGNSADSNGEQGFWPSYADMMSSFALILFFLMLLSYIQNLITGNDLQNTQELLSDTQAKLSATVAQVDEAQARLDVVTTALDAAQVTLDLQQEEIAGYSLQIEEQTETIASQEALIGEQSQYLSAANKELDEMKVQMQAISEVAVIRVSILEEMCRKITSVTGDPDSARIGDNGSIVLSSSVLFDVGSYSIKANSKSMLNELIDVFSDFLAEKENAKYVDAIMISGHTDDTGNEAENRTLSTDRANAVLGYLLSGKNGKLAPNASYFCAAGYGQTRPAEPNTSEAGRAANRRIEISIILKDDKVLDIVDNYLAIEDSRTRSKSLPDVPEADTKH